MELTREAFLPEGVFGTLSTTDKLFSCVTLEHAYEVSPLEYMPKVPAGRYQCKRGWHKLEHMDHPFETFEILNVPGHTNILFHPGNFNRDSEGCVLLGLQRQSDSILQSKAAFTEFMSSLVGIDSFELSVE